MKQKNDNMNLAITKQIEQEFAYIDSIISAHTNSAIAKVNAEALQTYWEVGEYISQRLKSSAWGSHIVDELADYLKRHNPQTWLQQAQSLQYGEVLRHIFCHRFPRVRRQT